MEFKVLELFSGIGGMHFAFQVANLPGHIVAAFDINTTANRVYEYAHNLTPKNNNIQSLSPKIIQKLGVNMILMSPPCQPHTRVGNQLDELDARSDALNHLCHILPECQGINFILMENVKGFEKSQARDSFLNALKDGGFHICEFILSPKELGVPNTRNRYYCLARRNAKFPFDTENIIEDIPRKSEEIIHFKCLKDFLELEISNPTEFLVKDKDLIKRVALMDIVTDDDTNTMCFTKSYTHYAEGTGSTFTPLQRNEVDNIFIQIANLEQSPDDNEKLNLLRKLHLRYFSPKEVAHLMCFPKTFVFPPELSNRQRYRLLGNSINVKVVSELIKILCN